MKEGKGRKEREGRKGRKEGKDYVRAVFYVARFNIDLCSRTDKNVFTP